MTIGNINAPNGGVPQSIREMVADLKGNIDSNTVIVGDLNTLLPPADKSSR